MGETLKNIVITVIIFAIVRAVIPGFQKIAEAEKPGEFSLEKFVIRSPKILNVIIITCLIGTMFFFIIPFGTLVGWWNVWTHVEWWQIWIVSIFVVLGLALLGIVVIKRITVDGDNITYRDPFGINHHYTWDDVTKVVMKKDEMIVYGGKRKLFTVNFLITGGWPYLFWKAKELHKTIIDETGEELKYEQPKGRKKLSRSERKKLAQKEMKESPNKTVKEEQSTTEGEKDV